MFGRLFIADTIPAQGTARAAIAVASTKKTGTTTTA